ncbi:hypothetical protein Hanom_Chr00s024915g01764171 [Helianthus anomalus]
MHVYQFLVCRLLSLTPAPDAAEPSDEPERDLRRRLRKRSRAVALQLVVAVDEQVVPT